MLAGVALWPWYPFLALPGFFLFFLFLPPASGLGFGPGHWLTSLPGLIPPMAEVGGFLGKQPRLGAWRPLWIGSPIGFVGTLGAYFTVATSI